MESLGYRYGATRNNINIFQAVDKPAQAAPVDEHAGSGERRSLVARKNSPLRQKMTPITRLYQRPVFRLHGWATAFMISGSQASKSFLCPAGKVKRSSSAG